MRTTKKSVFLTGHSGFTGYYMAEALNAAGYRVLGLSTKSPNDACMQCDLADKAKLQQLIADTQPDYVIHLAGIAFVVHDAPDAFYQAHVINTKNLLDALCQVCAPQKIILASSANVYGRTNQSPIDETIAPDPVNTYARSKLQMEQMAAQYFDRLPIIITRAFNYTGPMQNPRFLVPKIVQHYQKKQAQIALGNLDVIRDISDVRFVVDCFLRLLETGVPSEIYNICSGQGIGIGEILTHMADISGHNMRVVSDPQLIRSNEIKQLIGANQKLMQTIGHIKPFALTQTLQDMYLKGSV